VAPAWLFPRLAAAAFGLCRFGVDLMASFLVAVGRASGWCPVAGETQTLGF